MADQSRELALLSNTEEKLVRLALCPGAKPGEVATAAERFFQSLRRRNVSAEELIGATSPVGDMRVPFGKFRGRPIRDVPLDYLEWMLATVEGYPALKRAVERYLRSQEVAA